MRFEMTVVGKKRVRSVGSAEAKFVALSDGEENDLHWFRVGPDDYASIQTGDQVVLVRTVKPPTIAEPLTEDALSAMVERATDGGDHEWGWYVDHVPMLVAEIRSLRRQLEAALEAKP